MCWCKCTKKPPQINTDKCIEVILHYLFLAIEKRWLGNFVKENGGILQFATYGGVGGTYTAFTIEDKEIRGACREALRKNENYINNMCSW